MILKYDENYENTPQKTLQKSNTDVKNNTAKEVVVILSNYSILKDKEYWIKDEYKNIKEALEGYAGVKEGDSEAEKKRKVGELHTGQKKQRPTIKVGGEQIRYFLFLNKMKKHLEVETVGTGLLDTINNLKQIYGIDTKTIAEKTQEIEQTIQETIQLDEYKQVIQLLGSGIAQELLYIYHPELKNTTIANVESMLAGWLGDFALPAFGFSEQPDIDVVVPFLQHLSMREAVVEAIRTDVVVQYKKLKTTFPKKKDQEYMTIYFDKLRTKTQEPQLLTLIEEQYQRFITALAYQKPDYIVSSTSEDRELPDFGQKINIAEIRDKKKMLIADEMGLGKSASVILAKESLRVKKAIIIAPSNVIPTWEGYLSDDPMRKGLFVSGKAPKVITMADKTINKILESSDADYILLSQEKLTTRYIAYLKGLGHDMIIVDEQHKIKKSGGVWSKNLQDLAESTIGEDQYLALLTGTPATNKVSDIAAAIKLIYLHDPVISKLSLATLKNDILNGNLKNIGSLRKLLIPYMQAKTLEYSEVVLPKLTTQVQYAHLTPEQENVYESILDDDEMYAMEKMDTYWKLLHNSCLLDLNPEVGSPKLDMLQDEITNLFAQGKKKIVVFVNQRINDVLQGEQHKLITNQLKLDEDVVIHTVAGGTDKKIRQPMFDTFNRSSDKSILFLSGAIGDVGIDLTGGDAIIHYDLPWTMADYLQQIARVYRFGQLKDILHKVLLTKGKIDEGVWQYMHKKWDLVTKLIHGVPLTEFERKTLHMMEKGDNPRHNKELAEFYTSEMQKIRKLNQYFQNLLNTTPEAFDKYMQIFGEEYAKVYEGKGVKNYQSNANRLTGTLITQLLQESGMPAKYTKILDIASGPRMLRKHIVDTYQSSVTSLDGNPHHFQGGGEDTIVATLPSIPGENQTYDVLHFSLALQDLAWNMRHEMFDRAKFFLEAHRVLKQHGTMVIQLPYRYSFKNTEQLKIVLDLLGFSIDGEKTGMATGGNKYSSYVLTLRKKSDKNPGYRATILEKLYDYRDGLKLSRLSGNEREQPGKEFLENFSLAGKTYNIDLNSNDRDIKQEENEVLAEMKSIVEYYGGITKIPREVILQKGYIYYSYGKNKQYKLMKTYSSGKGFIEYIGK